MKIDSITIPASPCSHLILRVTAAGQTRDIHITRDDIALDGKEELEDAVIARVRSFARENGYATIAQLRTGLAGKEFHI